MGFWEDRANLAGKVAVVMGGGGGLGRACALDLGRADARLTFARDPRLYQITSLALLLAYGKCWLHFEVGSGQLAITLGAALLAQFLGTRFWRLPAFDPRSALISGLMEILSIARICVGMVSTPGGRQNRLAVILSKEMVKTISSVPATSTSWFWTMIPPYAGSSRWRWRGRSTTRTSSRS